MSAKGNDKKLLKRGNLFKYRNGKHKFRVNNVNRKSMISSQTHKISQWIEAIAIFMLLLLFVYFIWESIGYILTNVMT